MGSKAPDFNYVLPHDYSDFYNIMKGSSMGGLINLYSDNGIIESAQLGAGATVHYRGCNYIGPGYFERSIFHQQ